MAVRHALALGATALALLSGPALAGPCAERLYRDDLALGRKLNAAAARGRTAVETTGALLHHQPTPSSVAQAEAAVGDLSEAEAKAATEAMEEARKADVAGDKEACEKALDDFERILRP
jgi:hypothetical protein